MTDAQQRELWILLADQYLDSDMRPDLPRAALRCVEIGCSRAEAARIWRYEVTPAVWPNAWSVAGEWAMWDEPWLLEQIQQQRLGWLNRAGPLSLLLYRLRAGGMNRVWEAIDRCIATLEGHPPGARAALAADLESLARIYFDFWLSRPKDLSAQRRAELERCYDLFFLPIFLPLTVRDTITGESPDTCAARVRKALAGDT